MGRSAKQVEVSRKTLVIMGGLQAGGRRANVCSKVALRLLCATWQLGLSLGCNNCFIDLDESRSLCIGYVHGGSPVSGIPLHDNVEECFKKLDVFFTDNPAVISAARVGAIQTSTFFIPSIQSAFKVTTR